MTTQRGFLGFGATALFGLFSIATVAAADNAYDKESDRWYQSGQEILEYRLSLEPNTNQAKNVILFIADGLGVTAATAARIYDGQEKGGEGEDNFLAWETFPNNALVKTYSADAQIPSSAATASAIATGLKTNGGTISVPDSVTEGNCAALMETGFPETIAERAASFGKSTGVITTTIITDATPASQYAHSPARGWWNPANIPEQDAALGCKDMTLQLIESDVDVALGGGRISFFPDTVADPEQPDRNGVRPDSRNLVEEWQENRPDAAYVESREELAALDLTGIKSLLGLFSYGSMVFEDESADDGKSNPSLADMTEAAIDVLSKNENGFFLMVEHEGTDDLQHGGTAKRAFDAAREFSEAVEVALAKVDLSETLIVVTADHSQAIVFAGAAPKGNPVLGLAREANGDLALAGDEKPYTTVGFYAGPGAIFAEAGADVSERPDPSEADTFADDYKQQALFGMRGVPHGGEDVPVYASGPWSHLFDGLIEQNAIFHFIVHAMEPAEKGGP